MIDGNEIDIKEIIKVVQSQIVQRGEDINIEIELPNHTEKASSVFEALVHAATNLKIGVSVDPILNVVRLTGLSNERKEIMENKQTCVKV